MYNILNYNELKEIMSKYSYNNSNRLEYIEKVVDITNIRKTYGKNVFQDEAEILLITDNKIINITFQPFIIKTYNVRDINNIEVEKQSKYEITAKIFFNDATIMVLDNKRDANEEWQYEYINFITKIVNHLINL